MGLGNKSYAVTDATGGTVAIARSDKREVILRSQGPDRTFVAFNETAVDGLGIYLDIGDTLILDELKCDADIYFVCATGETATIGGQVTL